MLDGVFLQSGLASDEIVTESIGRFERFKDWCLRGRLKKVLSCSIAGFFVGVLEGGGG